MRNRPGIMKPKQKQPSLRLPDISYYSMKMRLKLVLWEFDINKLGEVGWVGDTKQNQTTLFRGEQGGGHQQADGCDLFSCGHCRRGKEGEGQGGDEICQRRRSRPP